MTSSRDGQAHAAAGAVPRYAAIMRTSMSLVWSIAIAALGCGGQQGGKGGGESPAGTRADPIILTTGCPDDVPADAYQLTSAEIEGEIMKLALQYAGGCGTHRFFACWPDERFAESYPVQTWLRLYHDAGGDTCEGLILDTRYVDISAVLYTYQRAYGSSGPIVMHLRDTGLSVTYQPPNAPAAPPL
jgi:hypothetical protein